MSKGNCVYLFGVLLLITSCTRVGETAWLQPTSTIVSIVATTSPIHTQTPSSNPLRLTVTPENTLTDTPTPESGVMRSCLAIQPSLPGNQDYSGKIVFETHLPGSETYIGSYNFDAEGEISDISRDGLYPSVSPDQTKFAYYNYDKRRLEVYNASGELINTIAWREDWLSAHQWLDDQNIVLAMAEPDPSTPGWDIYPRTVIVVNPFHDKTQTLPPDFPDIDLIYNLMSWDRSGTTVYDPTLTRVVYPGSVTTDDYQGNGYILYGIPEKKKLAQIPSWFDPPPVWSPDGSKFIVKGDDEFYVVGYDGRVAKITRMNPNFDPSTMTGATYSAEYYDWSPDGRHVALWLYDFASDHRTLAILDTQTGAVIDTCIAAGYLDPTFTPPNPVWSPDGKSLVVAANYRPDEYGNDVVLIDHEKNAAYKLTNNTIPVGWLISP